MFTYSERAGTAAAEFGDAVPMGVRRERTRILRELSDRKNLEFRRRMVGRTLSAVTLEERGTALTTNFLKVEMSALLQPNRMVDVEIGGVSARGLRERGALAVL